MCEHCGFSGCIHDEAKKQKITTAQFRTKLEELQKQKNGRKRDSLIAHLIDIVINRHMNF